jgi:hypothetical protein
MWTQTVGALHASLKASDSERNGGASFVDRYLAADLQQT